MQTLNVGEYRSLTGQQRLALKMVASQNPYLDPSASAVHQLVSLGLVEHTRNHGVQLTTDGSLQLYGQRVAAA